MNVGKKPHLWLSNAYDRAKANWDEKSEIEAEHSWNYNWELFEQSTASPQKREGFADLYLQWDGETNPWELPIVKEASAQFNMATVYERGDLDETEPDETQLLKNMLSGNIGFGRSDPPGFMLLRSQNSANLRPKTRTALKKLAPNARPDAFPPGCKSMREVSQRNEASLYCDALSDDDWYGPMLFFRSLDNHGYKVLQAIFQKSNRLSPNCAAFIPHALSSFTLADDETLTVGIVTGIGSDREIDEFDPSSLLLGDITGRANKGLLLGTRFNLYNQHNEIVCRCQVSYKDGSHAQTLGPTIEVIETCIQFHGRGYCNKLLNVVSRSMMDLWPISRLEEKKTLPKERDEMGYILKATNQIDNVVDVSRKSKQRVTDRKFFMKHGFIVRMTAKESQYAMHAQRPNEEFIKFVAKDEAEGIEETIKYHCCENCTKQEPQGCNYKRCVKCQKVYYCSRECQTEDWKFHKLWCKKDPATLEQKMIDVGLIKKNEDGSETRTIQNIHTKYSEEDTQKLVDFALGTKKKKKGGV